MKATKRSLTESERYTIVNGLRVAAERFKGHHQTLQTSICPACLGRSQAVCSRCGGVGELPNANPAEVRLAKQFERQYSDSIALAAAIEDAGEIELTTEVLCEQGQ